MAKRVINENITTVELVPQTHKLSMRVILPGDKDIDIEDVTDCGLRITHFSQSGGDWDEDSEDVDPTNNESYKKKEMYVRLTASEMEELGKYLLDQSKELSRRVKSAEGRTKRGPPPKTIPAKKYFKKKNTLVGLKGRVSLKGKRNGLAPRSR